MANICSYEVHVRGTKKAAYMIYASMPSFEYLEITSESNTGSNFELVFKGNCKWSVNFGVKNHWNGAKVNLTSMTLDKIAQKGAEYADISLRVKSQVFNCEILCHYWSEESGFDQFDHYRNGQFVKRRKIAYDYNDENVFDWKKTEFVGHEGEYDESVDGEEQDANLMGIFGMLGTVSAPQSRTSGSLSGLEKELYLYFKDGDKFQTAKATVKDFPGKSTGEIENALNSLCEKGYFSSIETCFGETYSIDSSVSPILTDDYDDDDNDEIDYEKISSLCNELTQNVDKLKERLKDAEKTPEDIFVWTFNKKQRVSSPEWSITMPDNYVKIKSEEGRAFELVPKGYEKNPEDAPVRILPSKTENNSLSKDQWPYDHRARKGVGLNCGLVYTQVMRPTGAEVDFEAESFGDIIAVMGIIDTGGSSYSLQCMVLSGSKIYQIRFQTGLVFEPQKELLIASVFDMLKTFKANDKVSYAPKEPAIASQKVLEELKQGKTEQFDKAVVRAVSEYTIAHNGHIEAFGYRLNNDYLKKAPEIALKEMLSECLQVLEFYYKKADELVEKLKNAGVSSDVIKKVYEKLKDLDQAVYEIKIDHSKSIKIKPSAIIEDIKKKWASDEKAAEQKKKAQEEQEKKAYEKTLSDWKQKVQKTESDRKKELERIKNEKRKALTDMAEKKYSEVSAAAKKKKQAAEKKKQNAEKTLEELGAFKFSEKKAQKALIAEAEAEIAAAVKTIDEAQEEKTKTCAEAVAKAKRFADTNRSAVEKKYPLPAEPKKPEAVIMLERREQEQQKAKEEEELGLCIYSEMELGKGYRIKDIMSDLDCVRKPRSNGERWTSFEITCVVRQLLNQGRLINFHRNGESYYQLA